jgi:hypothetical protein
MKYPYEFVDQMLWNTDDKQLAVQLYCFSGRISKENLMEFCKSKNREFPNVPLYKLMILDKRENATFNSGLSEAGFSQETTNHIRAIYTFNQAEQSGILEILDHTHATLPKI